MEMLDSLRLELEGERHCHREDNEYLLARAQRAEAAAKDFARALLSIAEPLVPWGPSRESGSAQVRIDIARGALCRYPEFGASE